MEPSSAGMSSTARLLHDMQQPLEDVRIGGRRVSLAEPSVGADNRLSFSRTPLRASTGALAGITPSPALPQNRPPSSPVVESVVSARRRVTSAPPGHRRSPLAPAPPPSALLTAAGHVSPVVEKQLSAYNRLCSEVDRNQRHYSQLLSTIESLNSQLVLLAQQDEERTRLCRENEQLRRDCDAISSGMERGFSRRTHNAGFGGSNVLTHRSSRDSGYENGPGGAASNEDEYADGPQWACGSCTFLNHPAISVCEQCEMPRILLGAYMHDAVFGRSVSGDTSGLNVR